MTAYLRMSLLSADHIPPCSKSFILRFKCTITPIIVVYYFTRVTPISTLWRILRTMILFIHTGITQFQPICQFCAVFYNKYKPYDFIIVALYHIMESPKNEYITNVTIVFEYCLQWRKKFRIDSLKIIHQFTIFFSL